MDSGNWTRVLRQVEKLVKDHNQIVSFKSLSDTFSINVDLSKRVLFAFLEKHWELCDAVFCLNGVLKFSMKRSLQLVESFHFQVCKDQYHEITSIHVYCVGPKGSISAMGLHNARYQTFPVVMDCPSSTQYLYGIHHSMQDTIPQPSLMVGEEKKVIKKESVNESFETSHAAIKKSDVPAHGQQDSVMSPSKRLLKNQNMEDETQDEEMEEGDPNQLKKRKSEAQKSQKTKKKKSSKESHKAAKPVHRRVLKSTINEKGEEILEEVSSQSPDKEHIQKGESKRASPRFNTRSKTKKQSSITSFFSTK